MERGGDRNRVVFLDFWGWVENEVDFVCLGDVYVGDRIENWGFLKCIKLYGCFGIKINCYVVSRYIVC